MNGKAAIAGAAVFLLCANIRLGCSVSTNGSEYEEQYGIGEFRRGIKTAERMCGELGLEKCASIEHRLFLSFRPIHGDARKLTDLILRSNPRIARGNSVYYNGEYIGCIENEKEMEELLKKCPVRINSSALELIPTYIDTDKVSDCADLLDTLAKDSE